MKGIKATTLGAFRSAQWFLAKYLGRLRLFLNNPFKYYKNKRLAETTIVEEGEIVIGDEESNEHL